MDWNAFYKSVFLSILLAVGLFLMFNKSCNENSIQNNSDSTNLIIEKYKHMADSLLTVANKLDSLLKVGRDDIDTTSNSVIKYVTVYRTKHDTIEKLIACDSLAKYSEQLVIRCREQDSLHIEKEVALSGAIDQLTIAVDNCQNQYGVLASKYEEDVYDLQVKKNRNRNIAIISSSIAVIEGLIIGILIK